MVSLLFHHRSIDCSDPLPSPIFDGLQAVLFRCLQDETQGFFGDAGQVEFSDRTILFVDQSVSIVKHILESPQVYFRRKT